MRRLSGALCYSRRPGPRRQVTVLEAAAAVDRFLLRVNRPVQYTVIAATVLHMIAVAIPNVPRAYVDYARFPLLSGVHQYETYGPDTIGNSYVAKVVLNDPLDMYTKARLEQTPLEKATWTREESAPYPPAALLTAAGLYAIGAATGIGFYGMVVLLAALFVALSLWYFLNTRWYLFPAPVPELRVLRTSVRLRAGRLVPRHARRGHDRARPRPLEAPGQSPPDGARHHDEALAGGVRVADPDHAAWHRDDLCRHPARRFRAPVFHLGQLPEHLHVPRPGQGQPLRHDRGGRTGRALHDCAVVRRDATRVRHGGSDRVVAGSVRDVRRHQDAGRPAPADRAPGAGQAGSAQHRGLHRPRAPRRGSGCVPARVGALHHDRSALRSPGAFICGESAGRRFATTRGIRCAPSGCCCRSAGTVPWRHSHAGSITPRRRPFETRLP